MTTIGSVQAPQSKLQEAPKQDEKQKEVPASCFTPFVESVKSAWHYTAQKVCDLKDAIYSCIERVATYVKGFFGNLCSCFSKEEIKKEEAVEKPKQAEPSEKTQPNLEKLEDVVAPSPVLKEALPTIVEEPEEPGQTTPRSTTSTDSTNTSTTTTISKTASSDKDSDSGKSTTTESPVAVTPPNETEKQPPKESGGNCIIS